MNTICPISTQKTDENSARFIGAFTLLTLVIFLFSNSLVPLLLLIIDFSLRASELSKYSILAIISKYLRSFLNINSKFVNAGPKVFAARIGLIFSVLILVCYIFEMNTATLILTFVFGFCAFLESSFGFCVACKIYPYVYKLFNKN